MNNTLRAAILYALLMMGAVAVALPSTAAAQEVVQTYAIPAGDLDTALQEWASQSGQQLMYAGDLVQGKRSRGLSGGYAPGDALERLLQGSGLRPERLNPRTLVLKVDAPASKPAERPQVTQPEPVSIPIGSATTSEVTEMPTMVVTGTHIRGTNPISPIIVLERTYIEHSGKNTVADVIRTLPQNFNGGGNVGAIGAGTENTNGTDASRINLRGLGTGATLVLLNGHRLAFSSETGGPDISGIPLSAVESIEVLTDSASAIYGSDAIAGVVNIKLLQSFDGAETTAHFGNTTDGGGLQQRYAQLLGTTWSSGNALLNVEFAKDKDIDRSQRTFTLNLSDDDYSLLPNFVRRSAFASVSQALSTKITAHLDAMYSDRESDSIQSQSSAFRLASAFEAKQQLITAGLTIDLSENWGLSLTFQHGEDEALTGGRLSFISSPTPIVLDPQLVTNRVKSGEATISGKLFDLPAGPLQVAVGGGHRDFSLDRNGAQFTRSSTFGFSEARVPLIGKRSTSSSLPVLEGVIAARYEKFDDFGSTFDPKLGLSWRATDKLTLRASWGTSFRAPELFQHHGPTVVDLRNLNPAQNTKSTYISVGGGNPDLTAEKSNAWNLNVLYEPDWARNLQLTFSVFQIEYEDRIAMPFNPLDVAIGNQPIYAQYFTYDPSQAQQTAAVALGTGQFTNFTGQPYSPNNVAFILDSRLKNLSRVRARGLDVQLDYNVGVQSGDLATFFIASLLEQKQMASPFVPTVETTGTVFNPPHYRVRGGATWTVGNFAATGVLNIVGGYDNNVSVVQSHVSPWLTVDAQLSYRPSLAGFWSGLDLNLSVQNLLNRAPPSVARDTFASSGDVGFDSTNASAVGRMIGIQVRKSW